MECLVTGAGTAGATAAWLLAVKGVRTTLVDARARENVGASWVNGVEPGLFDELQLPTPPNDVWFHRSPRFVVQARDTDIRCVVDDLPTVEVDMRALNAWLLDLCEQAGVRLQFRTRATIGDSIDGRRTVTLRGVAAQADMVIDAGGLTGSRTWERLDPEDDVCSAYQAVYDVTDVDAARAWFLDRGLRPTDTLSMAGVEAGYSICNATLSDDASHVALLTGAMHRDGLRRGGRIAADFVRATPWIGRRRFGGGGLIPLRAPWDSFVDDQLIRLGNAAGMVFPQHGSGVAPGMRAAAIAANTAAAALQLADTTLHGLWPFNGQYYRGPGGLNAMYQPLRYLSSSLAPHELELLIASGAINPSGVRAALAQQPMAPDTRALWSMLRHARDLAPLLPALGQAVTLGRSLHQHALSFPGRGPYGEYRSWCARHDRLMRRARALAHR